MAPVDLLFVYDLVAIRNGATGYLALQPMIAQHGRLLTDPRNGDRAAERDLKVQFTAPNRAHLIQLDTRSLSALGWAVAKRNRYENVRLTGLSDHDIVG